MHRHNWTWHSSSDCADQAPDEPPAETQQQIKAAALQVASFIVSDDRYVRAIAFVSDASENDEVASMLIQVASNSHASVNLIKLLIRAEFDLNAVSKDTILRTNSLASKGFGIFARGICRSYVCTHVLPIVRDIIQGSDYLEINADLLCKQSHILALPEDERAAAISDAIARNANELASCVSRVIDGLSSPEALRALPSPVVSILKYVGEMSSEIKMSSSVFVSSLFLLRLVNPALIQPDFYDSTIIFSPESRRKLLLITKIMQTLGNHGIFGAKEAFMMVMNEHLESLDCVGRLETFLHDLLAVSNDSDVVEVETHATFSNALSDDCLQKIRTFFCRHSAAILKRLQCESFSRAVSVSEIVSRDLSFAAAITGLNPNSGYLSLQAMQEFKQLYCSMFQTYASAPQFEFIPELEAFDRENVCYSGPDALDGSAVIYICLERFKVDHLKIANCVMVRLHFLFSAAIKRPFNILVDCTGVQASSSAVVAVMKQLSATLLATFDSAAKKKLKNLFLVHPSVDTLHNIQVIIQQMSPKLWQKVVAARRWTSIVSFIAAERIMLPDSTRNSSGSLHPCIKINRKNKRQSRFAKVMVDSLANIGVSSGHAGHCFIKNEIMFCDIIAIQDSSEPTKLMITYNSSSTFVAPPNQSQGYFFKSRLFPTKHSVTHRVYEFRNTSERDDLRSALTIQRSLRMQVAPSALDPTFKGADITHERAQFARIPCPVFMYKKIGRKTGSVIDRVLKLSCDSCLIMAGDDIRHEVSFNDIESCWSVGSSAHMKTFAGATHAFSLLDESACKEFVDSVRLGISACLSRNVVTADSSFSSIALFQPDRPPQSLGMQRSNSAGHIVDDDFASISLGDVASGDSTPPSPALTRPVPTMKRKASKFISGLGATRAQSML